MRLQTIFMNVHMPLVMVMLPILLTVWSASGLAGGTFNGGGGGTDLAFEFQQAARKAISQIPRIETLTELKAVEISRQLESARVVVVEHDLFVAMAGVRQKVAAINYPSRRLIIVSRPAWSQIKSSVKKEAWPFTKFSA